MKRIKTGSLMSNGKKALSRETAKAVKSNPVKKQGKIELIELDDPSLVFFKKTPVTFQLTSSENPKDFELMCFVIKACDKASANPLRTVIHVEQTRTGSRIVACDGARLHAAEISKKIKSGNYKPRVTKDAVTLGEPEKDMYYPSWVKNIPENAQKRGIINLDKTGLGKDREETEKLSIAFNSIVKQTGKTINFRYLDDLTNGFCPIAQRRWAIFSA